MTTQDFVANLVDKFAELVAEKVRQSLAATDTESFNDRIQRLEDKFDQLTTASDERIEEVAKQVITGFDLTDNDGFDDAVTTVVRDLTFRVDATVEVSRY